MTHPPQSPSNTSTLQPPPSALQFAINGTANPNTSSSLSAVAGFSSLDASSLQAIGEVKQIFNLSSDVEALRALIAIGHRQFKKM